MNFTDLLANPFTEFGVIFIVLAIVTSIMHILRQPSVVAFIITGIIFSSAFLGLRHVELEISAQLGVVFLLFLAGLHLNPYFLKSDGKTIVGAGLMQIILTGGAAFALATMLGFPLMTAGIVAISLTLSSTIISLKIIADRKHNTHLYSKLSIGVLLLQDVFVALAIVVLNALGQSDGGAVFSVLMRNVALALVIIIPGVLFQKFFLQKFLDRVAKSQEMLFIFIISWMLFFASLFKLVGFSLEVGALIAGVFLASSYFATEISAKVAPLRDFFLMIFFVHLGTEISFENLFGLLPQIIILTTFVLIVKPLIVFGSLSLLGFTGHVSARTALNLSHISEFSLILVAMAASGGLLGGDVVAIITMVALLSITLSTYLITYDTKIIAKLSPLFKYTERKNPKSEHAEAEHFEPQIIVVGAKRGGRSVIKKLQSLKKHFLVIDYNPETIKNLKKRKVDCIFGDVHSLYSIDEISYNRLEYVISTTTSLSANLASLHFFKNRPEVEVKFICYAEDDHDALNLYSHGADLVLIPHHFSGKLVSSLIEECEKRPMQLDEHKNAHLEDLKINWKDI